MKSEKFFVIGIGFKIFGRSPDFNMSSFSIVYLTYYLIDLY